MNLPLGESSEKRTFGRAQARVVFTLLGLALAAGVFVPSHGAQAAVAYQKSDQGYCIGAGSAGNMASGCNAANSVAFTYTPQLANDGVLFAVGCAADSSPSSVTLSGSGWTFTQVGSIIGSSGASGWLALFKAYAPNTSQVTITQTWNGVNGAHQCGNGSNTFMNDLVDEWKGMDPTNFVDAVGTLSNGSSGCSANVTPNAANDGLDGFCNGTITGVGGGFTKGADDTQGDWSEYKVLSGGAGVPQTVNFTSTGAANEFAVAIKPLPVPGIQVSSRSDILSDSRPSATSNHTIAFTVNNSIYGSSISGSSTLTLTLPSGFSIPANLDCGDIDVATSSQFNFNWPACQQTATAWGVTTTGLLITLIAPTDTNVHVTTSTPITIKIGSNATVGQQGGHWITNPSAGVYTISVGGTFNGSGNMLVAIQSAVTVAATVAESLSLTVSSVVPSAVTYQKSDQGYCNSGVASGNMPSVCGSNPVSVAFTYTPQLANDGVLFAVGCAADSSPSSVTLSGSGWTFTQVGSIIGSSGASGWLALFRAYAPNTSQVTITQTWNGLGAHGCGTCSNTFMNDLVDEWKGMDPTNFVDAVGTLSNGSSGCTASVTSVSANDGIDGFCNDTVTGVGNGYTKGADDTQQDWTEYKVLSGGAGASTTVNFTSSGAANEFAVAIKPPPNCTADDGATVNQIATTASSVPFGIISPNTFYQGCQDLTVSTNAGNGYSVTVQESSAMKTASGITIPDTTCDAGTCSESAAAAWATATHNGFGHTCFNKSNHDCNAAYSNGTSFRQAADISAGETAQPVMSSSTTASATGRIKFRLSPSSAQAAGTYTTIITYIITGTY